MTPIRSLPAFLISCALLCSSFAANAQSIQTSGAQLVVPANAEITLPNDQAHVTLTVQEQDKDQATAASRVNQKMKQGIDIVKRQDPQAQLRTRGYFTYAVYADDAQHNNNNSNKPRAIVGWRVGQTLEVTTTNLQGLPKTVAAAQSVMALNGLDFGLTPASSKKLDDALIDATYRNLNERIVSIARTMGRNPADISVDTLDFEGSGNFVAAPKAMMMRAAAVPEAVAEPSFEPGESTLSMRLVARLRIK
ncbi:uncharacterized protein YggE [Herbaspirillum sp. Sphag1AN]|uniref:SIMPL domain-containing protein n=1 Tax=unclassified Herbaspirillum TaxID=2624150 RepID=UPI00161BA772|nr:MULTISPECIES: SIMPL domain-containing protein [unclassified Herbaspirillum]MBB3212069.1 uncharacterized protein YggE [Herbaspirillum sp. Sphag1AN]MBB3244097.1 uncharacterized protein YggE [Herbaspirillum sp. Sphag64]